MITEAILKTLMSVLGWLPNMPDLQLAASLKTALDVTLPFFKVAFYFVPAQTFLQIFAIQVALWAFRVAIAVLKTVWASLPVF